VASPLHQGSVVIYFIAQMEFLGPPHLHVSSPREKVNPSPQTRFDKELPRSGSGCVHTNNGDLNEGRSPFLEERC
jgi:hypothetical protein